MHFLDDILVTGRTQDEHVANLRFVLKRLDEAGLKLNNEKCLFFKPSVECLGHKIDRDGLHPSNVKVRAIQDAPKPKNVTELRSWPVLLNYYGRFLPSERCFPTKCQTDRRDRLHSHLGVSR